MFLPVLTQKNNSTSNDIQKLIQLPGCANCVPLEGNRTLFKVWAPFAKKVDLKLTDRGKTTLHAMKRDSKGYHFLETKRVKEGARYTYLLNQKKERPFRKKNRDQCFQRDAHDYSHCRLGSGPRPHS